MRPEGGDPDRAGMTRVAEGEHGEGEEEEAREDVDRFKTEDRLNQPRRSRRQAARGSLRPPAASADEVKLDRADDEREHDDRHRKRNETPEADGVAEAFDDREHQQHAGLDGGEILAVEVAVVLRGGGGSLDLLDGSLGQFACLRPGRGDGADRHGVEERADKRGVPADAETQRAHGDAEELIQGKQTADGSAAEVGQKLTARRCRPKRSESAMAGRVRMKRVIRRYSTKARPIVSTRPSRPGLVSAARAGMRCERSDSENSGIPASRPVSNAAATTTSVGLRREGEADADDEKAAEACPFGEGEGEGHASVVAGPRSNVKGKWQT